MELTKKKDLLEGNPFKVILSFSLFFILGDFLQQLYNVVDSAILGRFVSTNALAAMGVATPIMNLVMFVIVGFTIGSGIVFSRWYGKGDIDSLRKALSTALIVGFIFTIIFSAIVIGVCKPFLRLLKTPEEIIEDTSIYLYIVFAANIFTFLYNFYSYSIRSIGNSFTPLVFLIISTIVNLLLDLLFVVGFKMGVKGAAIATLLSQALSALMVIVYTNIKIGVLRLGFKDIVFDKSQVKDILSYSSSVALQQSFVYIARIFVQGLIDTYGTAYIAGTNIGERLNALFQTPIRGYANAATTYFSQNLGANRLDRIKEGYKATILFAGINAVVFTLIGVFLAKPLVSLFVENGEVDAIKSGTDFTIAMASMYLFASIIVQSQAILRSMGALKTFVLCTLFTISLRVLFSYALNGWLDEVSVYVGVPASWFIGGILTGSSAYLVYRNKVKKFLDNSQK